MVKLPTPTQADVNPKSVKYRRRPPRNRIVSYYLPVEVLKALEEKAAIDFGGNASAAVTTLLAEAMNVPLEATMQ